MLHYIWAFKSVIIAYVKKILEEHSQTCQLCALVPTVRILQSYHNHAGTTLQCDICRQRNSQDKDMSRKEAH